MEIGIRIDGRTGGRVNPRTCDEAWRECIKASPMSWTDYIVKEQTLESAPALTSLRPPLKKRGPYKKKEPPAKKKRVSNDPL